MSKLHALLSTSALALTTLLAGCAEIDDPALASEAEAPLAAAAVTGTMACHLEYLNPSPFAVRPLVSFVRPMSEVAGLGVSVSNGTYTLFANQYTPSGGSNLGFVVSTYRVSTGRDINYLVLPPQSPLPGYLFETATRITTVTVGGVPYTHLRTYCALTP